MRLDGAVALVTGAGSGIGAATARALAFRGARLALVARSPESLRAVADELGGALILPGDLTETSFAATVVDRAAEHYGRLDLLVNNAGALERGGIEELDLDAAASMIRLNVEAAISLGTRALRVMKRQGDGWLVNISSIAGVKTLNPEVAVYGATKHALEAWSDAVRPALTGTGVGITCIEPGLVSTSLYDGWSAQARAEIAARPALHPNDVAEVVLFVLQRPARVRIPKLLILPDGEAH